MPANERLTSSTSFSAWASGRTLANQTNAYSVRIVRSLTSRSLRMTRRREAETRRIDDSQTRDAKDSCFRVDDRHRLVCSAHHTCRSRQYNHWHKKRGPGVRNLLTSRSRVVNRPNSAPDIIQNIRIAGNIAPWTRFRASSDVDITPEFADAPVGLHGDFLIGLV